MNGANCLGSLFRDSGHNRNPASTLAPARREPDFFCFCLYSEFVSDDSAISEIRKDYESGRMLAGEMKQLCVHKAGEWLTDLAEKREMWKDRLDEFLASDSM